MNAYSYKGPVMVFNVCVANYWEATTHAVSKKKTLSNFKYQFKKQNNRNADTKIDLPGEIKLIE